MPELESLATLIVILRAHVQALGTGPSRRGRPGERGYSTEAVVVTAALAALAIAATAIIAVKVTQQANSVTTR